MKWKSELEKLLTILNPQINIDLMEYIAHWHGSCICDHDKAQVAWCLVEMQFVVGGAVRNEGIIITP